MKNEEAEWSNDELLGCDQSHGKVISLCLKTASADANSFSKLYCKCVLCFLKGHLSENFPSSPREILLFSHRHEFALSPLKITSLLHKLL